MEVEEDQFSGEEASDDIDQRLHETISCIEKSLEETPESPNYQDIPKSKTLLDLPDDHENEQSDSKMYQTDIVDAPLLEEDQTSVQIPDSSKVRETKTDQPNGNSSEEVLATQIQERSFLNSPSSSNIFNGCLLQNDDSKSSKELMVSHKVCQSHEKAKVVHEVIKSPERAEAVLGVIASPPKAKVSQGVSKSPSKAEVSKSPSKAEVSKSPSKAEVDKSPSKAEVDKSPSKAEVGKSPSKAEVGKSPSKAEVGKSPSKAEVGKSPSKAEVRQEGGISPRIAEVCDEGGESIAKDIPKGYRSQGELAQDLCSSPKKPKVALEERKSCEKAEIVHSCPEKDGFFHEINKGLERTEAALERCTSPENEEVVQGEHTSSGKSMVNASQGNTSYDSPGIFQQTHITEESENHNESVPILQGPVDIGLLPQRGAKIAADLASVNDSQGLQDFTVSPRKKRERSPEMEVDTVRSSEGDDAVLKNNKKLKTPTKENDDILQESVTHKIIKKRGRPSLADKSRRSNPTNMPESLDKPQESATIGKEDITGKTKSADKTKKNSTIEKEDISKKNKALRRTKTDESEEDISLFLPEDWIFMGSVRQSGPSVGHIDIYYLTPPPRIKLRSRQELQAYMKKHNLDYDPLKFFIRAHVPFHIKSGVLKYHDSRTILSTNADESIIKAYIKHQKQQKEGAVESATDKAQIKQKEAAVESGTKNPDKSSSTKISTNRKRLSKKRSNFKRKYRSPVQSSLKIERPSPSTKQNLALSEPALRKTRERNTGPTTSTESCESVSKGLNESTKVTIKSEVTSPDNIRKTRLRSSTTVVEPPAISPVKAAKRSNQVLEVVEPVPSPKTPVKGKVGRPGRPRKTAPPPHSASPLPSEKKIDQRVIIQSKPKIVKSPYFSSSFNIAEPPKSSAGRIRDKNSDSAPPRSPFNLIQEDLFHDPWQMLIATIFLNSTSGRIAIPLALEFLKRWPTPQEACQAKLYDILDVIEPLGFGRTRAAIIIRFSHEFLTKDWKLPNDLYGIGKYGTDSYKIFCMKNAWKKVESDDPMLMMYLNWRRATEHLRKKFLSSSKNSKAVDPDESVINPDKNKSHVQQTQDQSNPLPRKRLRTRTK